MMAILIGLFLAIWITKGYWMKLPIMASLMPKVESLPVVEIRRLTPAYINEGEDITFHLYFFQPVTGMSFEMYAANKGSRSSNYDVPYLTMVDNAIAGRGITSERINSNRVKLTLTDSFDGKPIIFSRTVKEDTKTEGLQQGDIILAEEIGCIKKGVVSFWINDTSTTLPGASTIDVINNGKSFEGETVEITLVTENMIPDTELRFYVVNDGAKGDNWSERFRDDVNRACIDANCTWRLGSWGGEVYITFTEDYVDEHPFTLKRTIVKDFTTEGTEQCDYIFSDIPDNFIVYSNNTSIFIQDSSKTPEFIGWKVELDKHQVSSGDNVLLTIFDTDSLDFTGSVQIEDTNNDAFFVNSLATDIATAVAATSGVTFDAATMTLTVASDWERNLFIDRQCKTGTLTGQYSIRLKNASGQSKVKIADEVLFADDLQVTSFPTYLSGINISGAEFSSGQMPGTVGSHYFYPTNAMLDYYAAKGYKWFRFPFKWSRLQRTLYGDFDTDEESRIDAVVDYITNTLNCYCLIDPHDYAKYYLNGEYKVIGITADRIEPEAFYDFWERLANKYKNNAKVQFGIMNEPLGNHGFDWADFARGAVNAIRARTGATNLVTVPGSNYTGAHSWLEYNDTAFRNFKDPADNMVIEAHQYLNTGSSGNNGACSIDSHTRFDEFTAWCREYGFKAMLGEFGVSDVNIETECTVEITKSFQHLQNNQDVWVGYTLWAAGAQWSTSYHYRLNPPSNDYSSGVDSPQMDFAEQFIFNDFS